jgi:hypothetical protein
MNDIEYSRELYYRILTKGEEALEELTDFATDNPHPRSFEVLSTMMKNLSDISSQLVDLHVKKRDLQGRKGKEPEGLPPPTTTNNNVYVGSTEELQRLLKEPPIDVTPNKVVEVNDSDE